MDREQIKFLMDPRQAARKCSACGKPSGLFNKCIPCDKYGSPNDHFEDGPTMYEREQASWPR